MRASALQLFGGAGVEPLLSAREEQLYLRYAEELSAERSHQDRLARLVRLRQHDGYMAELLDHPHGALLVETTARSAWPAPAAAACAIPSCSCFTACSATTTG
ncbi:hypothetical protein M5585_03500 [Serratia ureilytica]